MPFLDRVQQLESKPAESHHNKHQLILEDAIDSFWHHVTKNEPQAIIQELVKYKKKHKISDEDFGEFKRELYFIQKLLADEDTKPGVSDAPAEGHHNRSELSPLDAIDSFMHYALHYTPRKMAEEINQYYQQQQVAEDQQQAFSFKVRGVSKLLSELLNQKKEAS